jgi:poly(3-hydroxybutyrate) depolymerase
MNHYFSFLLLGLLFLSGCKKDKDSGTSLTAFQIQKAVAYGTAANWLGQDQNLELDVYLPQNDRPANPLLVVMHSGAFYTGTRDELDPFCQYFAQRHFTTVPLSYRLGWNLGSGTNICGGDPYSVIQAGYRATQDLHAALRFLVANAKKYNIDTAKIFIGGASAGAITALNAAFVTQAEFQEFYPALQSSLGGLHSSGNTLPANYRIRGVLNMWGGVMNPSVMDADENIPVIGFHGSADAVVPYAQGPFVGCTNYPLFFGSKSVYDALQARGVASVLHTENSSNHGVYNLQYLAQNSYCFLQALLSGQKPSGSFTNQPATCQ